MFYAPYHLPRNPSSRTRNPPLLLKSLNQRHSLSSRNRPLQPQHHIQPRLTLIPPNNRNMINRRRIKLLAPTLIPLHLRSMLIPELQIRIPIRLNIVRINPHTPMLDDVDQQRFSSDFRRQGPAREDHLLDLRGHEFVCCGSKFHGAVVDFARVD